MRFALLRVRVAAEKALPFEPLKPNGETVAAMRAARRGELIKVGKPDGLLRSLNAEIKYTTRFQRDYRREKSARRCRAGTSITHCPANGATTATATSGRISFSSTASRMTTASNLCAWLA
jgi:hypothetical protein